MKLNAVTVIQTLDEVIHMVETERFIAPWGQHRLSTILYAFIISPLSQVVMGHAVA
jgi:hypothetical protein